MKTHQLADALEVLAKLLRSSPDSEVEDITIQTAVPQKSARLDKGEAALGLTALVALSKYSKAEWRSLIKELGLPIEVPAAYSARDTIGKLLQHLSDHPETVEHLQVEAAKKRPAASKELMRTLSLLLNGGHRK